ncbi:MAG: methyltransferase domain-containing protein [Pseudomonadota bacterium]
MKDRIRARHDGHAKGYGANQKRAWKQLLGYDEYLNFGYWTEDTKTGREACERMLDLLLERIPDKTGRILDVACGMGATSRYLTKHYPAESITGINISPEQVAQCRRALPGAEFRVMPAESLDFADASLDNILCVEAAFHFETRADFLAEAFRVLKPGGRLVLSDVLVDVPMPLQPAANRVAGIEAYRAIYTDIGFVSVEITDATQECVIRQTEVMWRWLKRLHHRGLLDRTNALRQRRILVQRRRHQTYVLVGARKP